MATKKKLNVKFLAIVLGVLAVGLAVVGGIVLVQYRNDPVKHITSGDELLAEGRPDKAVQQYLRGIGKAPYEMAYYDKAIAAVESITPQTNFDAREEFNRLMTILLAKAEKASPQDGRSAEEVRNEVLARVLDECRVFALGSELADLDIRDRVYSDLGRRFMMVDGSMRRATGQVDPRIMAAVRGILVEAAWRSAPLQTETQWEDSVERLREAIALDPTYVPGWYGLLRGQLSRFERLLIEAGPRSASRLLKGDQGLLAMMQDAREAVGDAPAPELDLLEAELGQVILFAGAAGDDRDSLISVPDPAALDGVIAGVSALSELPEWEWRRRLEDLRAAAIGVLQRSPSARTDRDLLFGYRDRSVEILKVARDAYVARDPDDARTRIIELVMLRDDPDAAEGKAEIVAKLKDSLDLPRGSVGLDQILLPAIRQKAAQRLFDLSIGMALVQIAKSERIGEDASAELDAAMASVEREFPPDAAGIAPSELLASRLVYNTCRGIDASRRGDRAAADAFFVEGSRAASQLRESTDAVLDGRTLDAAMILAEARGEFGEAMALFSRALERNIEIAEDLDMRLRFVELLAKSGRIDDAVAQIPSIRERATAEGDAVVLAKLAQLETGTIRVAEGVQLTDVRGADLLAAETEAALRGDLDERRALLQKVIDDPEVNDLIRSKALGRRAGIEAGEGDFVLARQFAQRVLELDPGNGMAMLIMKSDAETGIIERYRILAENASSDEQGRDVALLEMVRSTLRSASVIPEEERAELEAEYARILAALEAAPSQGPDVLRLLANVAVLERRFDDAAGLVERLVAAESSSTSQTVLVQARLLKDTGRPLEAIALVRDAIETKGLGSDGMFLVLGDLLSQAGERQDAAEAYQRAFEMAPTRPVNAMSLASSLLAEGRTQEVLPVLRAARSAGRETTAFLDLWLLQEMRAGNHSTAITERRRRYEFAPTDFRNAVALVQLLSESPVGREDVVWTPKNIASRPGAVLGEPCFDEITWARIPELERRKLAMDVRAARRTEAGGILQRMLELDGTDPQVVVAAAAFARSANEPTEERDRKAAGILEAAVASLREALDGDLEDRMRMRFRLRLARLLVTVGEIELDAASRGQPDADQRAAAAAAFTEAVETEGDMASDVDALVASTYIRRNLIAEAVPHQARLLREREASGAPIAERREVARRLVEYLVAVNDIETAGPVVDRYFRGDSRSAADLISLGAFTFGRADNVRRQAGSGDDRSWGRLLDEADDFYRQAAALQATNENIDFARATIAEYRWRWADEAERAAAFAAFRQAAAEYVARHADSWVARRTLVRAILSSDIEEEQESRFNTAVAQLREFLEIDPGHVDARRSLIDVLMKRGDQRLALDVAQAALDRDPSNRIWSTYVGRIRTELKEFDEAARQFGLLFEETGNADFLQMQTMALMNREPPRADVVIGLARANGQLFATRPLLAGLYAAAMAQTGRKDLALRNFESLYRASRQKASSGAIDRDAELADMRALAMVLEKLFPRTEEGAQDLQFFVETISDGKPTVSDLLAAASVWMRLAQASEEGTEPDADLVQRCTDAGVSLLRRASTTDPEHPEAFVAYLQLGLLLQKSDCQGAVDAFREALTLQPQSGQAMNNLAYLLVTCGGDLDEARELAENAVEQMPEVGENRDTLAAILIKLAAASDDSDDRARFVQQARSELMQASRLGESATPLIRLAELELEAGNSDAARSALLKIASRKLELDAGQQARVDAVLQKLQSPE